MDKRKRHRRAWRLAYKLLHRHLEKKFNLTSKKCDYDGPCLIVSNHVTNWDPILVGLSFPNKPTYFVASEHIFRWGFLSKVICWLLDPIPRLKGTTAADTVLTVMRRLRKGANVCIFAEGNRSWDGVTGDILPSTGIALPFFSYGGTALAMNLGEMGILLNISKERNRVKQQEVL